MSRRRRDRLFTALTAAAAAAALATLGLLIGTVIAHGAGALSVAFLVEPMRAAGTAGGLRYHIAGTAILVATAAATAIPLAVGSAVFLHVYLPAGATRRTFESLLVALNAVPSIVFGLFGFVVFFHLLGLRKSWLAGGLILGLMIVPTIAVAFLERLRAVPAATIAAAVALGLPPARIVTGVLLPQAAGGIASGTLLGLARAAGETAPIMFTAAIFYGARVPTSIADSPVLALPYHIFVLAQDTLAPAAQRSMWGAALVLLAFVVGLAALALPLRARAHEEARHG